MDTMIPFRIVFHQNLLRLLTKLVDFPSLRWVLFQENEDNLNPTWIVPHIFPPILHVINWIYVHRFCTVAKIGDRNSTPIKFFSFKLFKLIIFEKCLAISMAKNEKSKMCGMYVKQEEMHLTWIERCFCDGFYNGRPSVSSRFNLSLFTSFAILKHWT